MTLGDIPLLNLLFKKKDSEHEVTELVAFITPRALRRPEDDWEATRQAGEHLNIIEDWGRQPSLNQRKREEVAGEDLADAHRRESAWPSSSLRQTPLRPAASNPCDRPADLSA